MANTLKQRYYTVEASQESARDILAELKAQFVGLLSELKSGAQALFSTRYDGTQEPTSRGIDSDIVSVRMQYHFRNRR